MTTSVLGWVATAVFGASYFFREAAKLRKIQAAGACLWILYGIAIGAAPVVVANLIVAGAALYSSFWRPSQQRDAVRAADSVEGSDDPIDREIG